MVTKCIIDGYLMANRSVKWSKNSDLRKIGLRPPKKSLRIPQSWWISHGLFEETQVVWWSLIGFGPLIPVCWTIVGSRERPEPAGRGDGCLAVGCFANYNLCVYHIWLCLCTLIYNIYIYIINQINNHPVSPLLFGIIWSTSARLKAIWKIYLSLSLSIAISSRDCQMGAPNANTKGRVSMATQRMWRFGMRIESNSGNFTGNKRCKLHTNSEVQTLTLELSKDIPVLVKTLGHDHVLASPGWPLRTLKNGLI